MRQKDWENIVTSHSNSKVSYIWSYQNKVIGKHRLKSRDKSKIKVDFFFFMIYFI